MKNPLLKFFKTRAVLLLLSLSVVCIPSCKDEEKSDDPTKDISSATYEDLDESDYNANQAELAQYYNSDPIKYYAEFGFPSMAVASMMYENVGGNRLDVFKKMMSYFDPNKAQTAINQNQWQMEFINAVQNGQGDLGQKWLEAMIFYGLQVRSAQLNNPDDPNLGKIYQMVGDGMNFALDQSFFSDMGIQIDYDANDDPGLDWLCTCNMDDDDQYNCDGTEPDPLDEEVLKLEWEKIDENFLPAHRYDGKCATLASGLCLKKLGKVPAEIDEKFWLDLSKKIGAEKRGGARRTKINTYFASLGFKVTKCEDKNGETAVQQADKDRNKGCDVKMVYNDPAMKKGHVEFVHNIDVDGSNPGKATVETHKWGQRVIQTYEGGKFKNRDVDEFRGGWLSKEGPATFWTFCPVKK
jgi:hypothetical protein